MTTFLSKVADEILKSKDINNIEIIVPNNRTRLFLKKKIAEKIENSTWSPKITPIQDIFIKNSDFVIADDISLIFYLYEVYSKHIKFDDKKETLDEFYYWGDVLLSDFDDIDKYLVDAKKIFENIKNINEIDNQFNDFAPEEIEIIERFWNNVNYTKSDDGRTFIHRGKFLEFWDKLYDIYKEFTANLIEKKQVYQGLLYRQFVNNIPEDAFNKEEYFIVGFNALNNCEKKLFDFIKKNKTTNFFWDIDDYYIKNKEQEAGLFLRELLNKYPQHKNFPTEKNIIEREREIEIIEVPSPIAQIKLIEDILQEWKKKEDFIAEKTAIVLADENTLIPLLYSIPDDFYPYNVSMGYPIKSSASYAFLNLIFELKINAKLQDNITIYRTKDVVNLINHQFIKNLELVNDKDSENIFNNYRFTISSTDLFTILKDEALLHLIFSENIDGSGSLLANLIEVFGGLFAIIVNNENFIVESEFIFKIKTQIIALSNTIESNNINLNNKIIIKLLRNHISNIKIPFEGEPLTGIQIMGFIETRNLDFDRVIMLSINEDVFPKKNTAQSIIPYGLRKGYGLPSIEFQDSIFAYYFYRILQNAKDVKIFYSSIISEQNSEKSRFIIQIQNELKLNSKTNIINSNNGYHIKLNQEREIVVEKKPEMFSCFINRNANSNSSYSLYPTQINTYLKCKLQFYYKYIEKLKKIDSFDEDINKNFGSLFHETLKILYAPYYNEESRKVLIEKDYDKITREINNAVHESIKNVFSLTNENEIQNIEKKLFVDIVKKYVLKLLDYDKKHLPLEIISLEEEYKAEIEINGKVVELKGKIDRVDFCDNKYRVIDYKTGQSHKEESDIEKIFSQDRPYKFDTNAQILIYSHILFNKYNYKNICPGIFEIRSLGNKDYKYQIGKQSSKTNTILANYNQEIDELIQEKLITVIEDLFDMNKNFKQTKNVDNCKYCDYKNLCYSNKK